MNVIAKIPSLFQDQDLAFSFSCKGAAGSELLVHHFSVSENLFGLTQIDVELVSHEGTIDLHGLMDTPATVTVHHKYAGERCFSGVVAAASRGDSGHHRTMYQLTLLPTLHRLAHGSDCRIFQQMTVPDIIKQVLKEYGVADVAWDLTGEHVAREYCVQYRESHLEFIERIAAEEGIWYYFTHGQDGQHTLKFIDNHRIVPKCPDAETLEYNAMPSGAVKGVFCHQFSLREQLRSTAYTQRDYTFKNPRYNQEHTKQKAEDNGSADDYKLYDYPGRYKKDHAGKPFTQSRMESVRVDATTGSGTTNTPHLTCGHKLSLTDHPDKACNIAWLLLGVSHSGSQPQALKEEAGNGATTYSATFTAMPTRLPYAPPQKTKPLVDGPQIAHVVGPPGEEIYTDEHARVKVQFPWDRYGQSNEHSSCWIRVAQNWAGGKWGHVSIPRIGHEVIVDFLEGDPDQPILTGRTYHAVNQSPYKLPDHKTKMVIRSDSHKADYYGFNELTFEDEAGQENIYLHAQKDMTEKIENHHTMRVDRNHVQSVGHNRFSEVAGQDSHRIGGNMSIMVSGSFKEHYAVGNVAESVWGIREVGYRLEDFSEHQSGGNFELNAQKNISQFSGSNTTISVGENKLENIEKDLHLTVSGKTICTTGGSKRETVGNRLFIDVVKEIHLRCGPTMIKMSQDGKIEIIGTHIVINGKKVNIN